MIERLHEDEVKRKEQSVIYKQSFTVCLTI